MHASEYTLLSGTGGWPRSSSGERYPARAKAIGARLWTMPKSVR